MRSLGNLLAFSPELWLLLGAIAVFIVARFGSARTTTLVAYIALAGAAISLATQLKSTIDILDGAFLLDGYAVVVDVIILAAVALALLASGADHLPGDPELPEVPGFYLLATLGAMLAVSASELVSLFIALELLAINLYVLAALLRRGAGSVGVSIGYAILGGASSALLLYGLALLFGLTGQTRLAAAGAALRSVSPAQPAVMLMLSLLIGGFTLRLGLIPFRWWRRGFEVGVSLRVVLLVGSVGMVAALAVLGRILGTTFAGSRVPYAPIFAGVAAVVITAATLLAVSQTSLRRMLLYLMVAQSGFALAAFTDLRRVGLTALVVFMVASALTTIGALTAVIAYGRSVHTDAIRDLAGMVAATPAIALGLSVAVLSLAGVPPLAGFLGRLLILQAAVDGGYAWLAVIGAVNLVIASFGAVRLVRSVVVDPPVHEVVPARLDRGIRAAAALAGVGIVFMGLLLGPLYSAATYARAAILH